MILFFNEMLSIGKSTEKENKISSYPKPGSKREWGIRVSFWHDENILELNCSDGYSTLNILRITEL